MARVAYFSYLRLSKQVERVQYPWRDGESESERCEIRAGRHLRATARLQWGVGRLTNNGGPG